MPKCLINEYIGVKTDDRFCGVCLKNSGDALISPNIYDEYFHSLGLTPPKWLCCWCERRLLAVLRFQAKIRKADTLLRVMPGTISIPKGELHLKDEVDSLKKEFTITETKYIDLFYSEQEYVDVKIEVELEQRREGQHDVDIKEDASSDDDGTDMIPLNELKGENEFTCTETEISNHHENNKPVENTATPELSNQNPLFTQHPVITQLPVITQNPITQQFVLTQRPFLIKNPVLHKNAVFNKNSVNKNPVFNQNPVFSRPILTIQDGAIDCHNQSLRILLGHSSSKTPQTVAQASTETLRPPPDILSVIESLDFENYVVSDEVNRHIVEEVASLESWDDKKAFRKTLASYKFADFRCDKCVLGFETKELFDKHVLNHTTAAGVHPCKICTLYFDKYQELRVHQQLHKPSLKCPVCTVVSYDRSSALKHYVSRHSDITFSCHFCIMDFRRFVNLEKHLRTQHKKENSIGCAVCAKEFENTDLLKTHHLTHGPGEIKWHECSICKKKSRNAYHMLRHERAHETESMPLMCDICTKTFKTRHLLSAHIQRVHEDAGAKKFQCDECGKFFHVKAELRMHIQWTHRKEGGVKCNICGKAYRCAYRLKEHKSVVHDKVPKPKDKLCDIRGRGFNNKKTLQFHRYIHTGERPFPCPDCGQAFRQKCAMTLHYKAKHLRIAWRKLVPQKKKKAAG